MELEVENLLRALTLEEKISLVSGKDFFSGRGVERLGIPAIVMSDGPHGVRAQSPEAADHLGLHASEASTCFPSGAALGSSWNRELLARVGEALGKEAADRGIAVLLGPAFNIKRSPLCGRNFEYYSEDPYLSGQLAVGYIRGLQSNGVAACPKHFAANNQEKRRMETDSVVDERTLREIYLAGFETAVREGKPRSIMCAYNKLNGVFCSEHDWLLNQVLREEWGFDGAVISDWGAVLHREDALKGGLDLEMPGTGHYSDLRVAKALNEGTLTEAQLDVCVRRVIELALKSKDIRPGKTDFAAHHRLAQQAAEECLVLLKNEDQLLPLKKSGTIAVIGQLAKQPRYQGGGSSHVNSWKVDSPWEELQRIAPGVRFTYGGGYDETHGERVDQQLLDEAEQLARNAERVLLFIGLTEQYETEGQDRTDMRLPQAHLALAERVLKANPNTAVVLTSGAPVELPFEKAVKSILCTYTAGDGLGRAVAGTIFGDNNPSGRLAESWPLRLEDNPSYLTYPAHAGQIRYSEGVFVGYRYYESVERPVRFPFGHGLSYTTFRYAQPTVRWDAERGRHIVSVAVTNTGAVPGKEVIQLYIEPPGVAIPRPVKELKGFEKVLLQPGETTAVQFCLSDRAFAYYDESRQDWAVEPGDYHILVGASVRDIRGSATVRLKGTGTALARVDELTTLGELGDDPRTYPVLCELLAGSPMYRPAEMPDAPAFLRELPLHTANHICGSYLTPEEMEGWIERFNLALS